MAGVVVTIVAVLPVEPDSWLTADDLLLADDELLRLIREDASALLEDATFWVERVP